jgi:mycofactocin precursor
MRHSSHPYGGGLNVRFERPARAANSSVGPMTSEDADAAEPDAEAGPALIEDELIVEEISIDGMCGVY